jgi:hypothetical protein
VRAIGIVLRQLQEKQPCLPQSLAQLLMETLDAALSARALTMTELGRSLSRKSTVKARVKTMARFLGSDTLARQLRLLGRALAAVLLSGVHRPVLLVDWTEHNGQWLLYCALAGEGRALALYFEVYPDDSWVNPRTEGAFLRTLATQILPDCQPVLCSDAGFRGAWFEDAAAVGLDYVGRLVPHVQMQPIEAPGEVWVTAEALGSVATGQPEDRGMHRVRKSAPMKQRIVRYKGSSPRAPSQRRKPSTGQGSAVNQHRRMAACGWVLATSLSVAEASAERVVALYAQRMQVEELFRSLKSEVYGQGARSSRSRDSRVLSALWWVGSLLALVLHLVGAVAEEQRWHRQYQTNTTKDRRVLARMTLGHLVLAHHDQRQITPQRLRRALDDLRHRCRLDQLDLSTIAARPTPPDIIDIEQTPHSPAWAA